MNGDQGGLLTSCSHQWWDHVPCGSQCSWVLRNVIREVCVLFAGTERSSGSFLPNANVVQAFNYLRSCILTVTYDHQNPSVQMTSLLESKQRCAVDVQGHFLATAWYMYPTWIMFMHTLEYRVCWQLVCKSIVLLLESANLSNG